MPNNLNLSILRWRLASGSNYYILITRLFIFQQRAAWPDAGMYLDPQRVAVTDRVEFNDVTAPYV